MSKPRIIIADTDINYIIPLQQKFAEEYFEKIDLEIISDSGYYDSLFASSQNADILIVSEDLYTTDLRRHNIKNIFLMTERQTDNQMKVENVKSIYKYTNIKEIFSAIVGKGFEAVTEPYGSRKKTQVVLVCSASGGVGKTTIALGISACLNRNYKRVLYMDAARLQTFQIMLSNKSPIIASDVYAKLSSTTDNRYSDIKAVIRNDGFSYLPPFKASLMSVGLKYSLYGEIAISAKETGEYDYIIIDADTVLDEDKTKLMDIADKVIVVTKQNKSSVYATNILLANINAGSEDKYIFICNDFVEDNVNDLISTDNINRFRVSHYVEHLYHYEQLMANDLADEKDIQKITFLII